MENNKKLSNGGRKRKNSSLHISGHMESIIRTVHYVHDTIARSCDYCGKPMSPSDVNDFGSLCERCYRKEYSGK